MARFCPSMQGPALYLDCLEFGDKLCSREGKKLYNKIVIGIDQSYKNTGISIAADGMLKKITSVRLDKLADNTQRRQRLTESVTKATSSMIPRAREVIVIMERIRLSSQGFINIDYIKSIGALNACIVDVAKTLGVPAYSVDTRSWKSKIVGSSKPQANNYGIDPEKWPTIKYLCKQGYQDSLIYEVGPSKKKGVVLVGGRRCCYNDDAADSACIALYGFLPASEQLLEEEH